MASISSSMSPASSYPPGALSLVLLRVHFSNNCLLTTTCNGRWHRIAKRSLPGVLGSARTFFSSYPPSASRRSRPSQSKVPTLGLTLSRRAACSGASSLPTVCEATPRGGQKNARRVRREGPVFPRTAGAIKSLALVFSGRLHEHARRTEAAAGYASVLHVRQLTARGVYAKPKFPRYFELLAGGVSTSVWNVSLRRWLAGMFRAFPYDSTTRVFSVTAQP